jgi:hypothetical protein
MKTARLVRCAMLAMATLGTCAPQFALAGETAQKPAVVDIALQDGGTLHGQVVDLQGAKVQGVSVAVKTQDRDVATATTTADGRFSVAGLRGGVYQVAAGNGQGVYRLWSAGTAPPAAQKGAIVYTQYGSPGRSTWKMILTNPIVIGGAIATAIAVPVALANSHSASP